MKPVCAFIAFKASLEILFLFRVGSSMCIVSCHLFSQSDIEELKKHLIERSSVDQDPNCCDTVEYRNNGSNPGYGYPWEKSGKFEGDILLNEHQRRHILEELTTGLTFRNGITNITRIWPNRTLIYMIDNLNKTMDRAQEDCIKKAFAYLGFVSCVKFRPYIPGDYNAVRIQASPSGCTSHVGMQGGLQVLNLDSTHPGGRGCFAVPNIVHEILHALGFFHMHSSKDRDDYVDINWENIKKQYYVSFIKIPSSDNYGIEYDYQSIMHYSRKAFSANGEDTIVPKQPVEEFGRRGLVSRKDIERLKKMYECGND